MACIVESTFSICNSLYFLRKIKKKNFVSYSFLLCSVEVSEFADDNASTTETDENKVSEEIEDIENEEGIDGVSSEGEKTSGGTETVTVNSKTKFFF